MLSCMISLDHCTPKLCLIFIVQCMSLVNVSLPRLWLTNRIQNMSLSEGRVIELPCWPFPLPSPVITTEFCNCGFTCYMISYKRIVQNAVIVIDPSVHHCLWVIVYHMQYQFTVLLLYQFIVWLCGSYTPISLTCRHLSHFLSLIIIIII